MHTFHPKKYIWITIGYSLVACFAQDILFRNDDEEELVERNFIEPIKIPESILIEMKNIHNVTEFRNRFINVERNIILRTNDSTTSVNSRTASSVPRFPSFAQPALCQPEDQIVELEKPENGAVMLWPSCVRVKRCGGCCTSEMLTCNPTATSSINITVLQVRYNPEATSAFDDQGTRTFTLEQHDRCACNCKEKPEDCTPDVHVYKENECRCVCINQIQSLSCNGPKKIWDSRDCICKCRNIQQCSTGRYFNMRKCKCELIRNQLSISVPEHRNISREY